MYIKHTSEKSLAFLWVQLHGNKKKTKKTLSFFSLVSSSIQTSNSGLKEAFSLWFWKETALFHLHSDIWRKVNLQRAGWQGFSRKQSLTVWKIIIIIVNVCSEDSTIFKLNHVCAVNNCPDWNSGTLHILSSLQVRLSMVNTWWIFGLLTHQTSVCWESLPNCNKWLWDVHLGKCIERSSAYEGVTATINLVSEWGNKRHNQMERNRRIE